MIKVLARVMADAALIATLLFASAGSFVWWRAWILVAVLVVVRTISAVVVYRVNPGLARDRAALPIHARQPLMDKLLLGVVLATGFFGLPVLAALDVFRWHLLPRPDVLVSTTGLVVHTLGWCIKGLALYTNAFATSVVRLQHERKHTLVDRGIYGVVRHPFYAGTALVLVGMCLWLESTTATVAAVIPMTFVTLRIGEEERFLRRELAGYNEYAARVPHRLVPGVW